MTHAFEFVTPGQFNITHPDANGEMLILRSSEAGDTDIDVTTTRKVSGSPANQHGAHEPGGRLYRAADADEFRRVDDSRETSDGVQRYEETETTVEREEPHGTSAALLENSHVGEHVPDCFAAAHLFHQRDVVALRLLPFRDLERPETPSGFVVILFTESKETALFLSKRLKSDLQERVIVFTGDSDATVREEVIRNFDARVSKPADDYRILVTTEVLAEGVSLHRANVVLNYDIPWNPTRLIQRVGRVNCVDTAHERIHTYHFFPTKQSNDLIKLREAAEAKIQAFIEMLGADAQLLTEGEEIKSHDLFQALFAKSTITGEDDQQESELEYLNLIRKIRDEQLPLFERIKRLPKKARSARLAEKNEPSPALLTYFRRGRLEKFFIARPGAPSAELDFFATARLLACDPPTPRADVGADFYPLLDANKIACDAATSDEGDGQPARSARDTGAKLLQRLRTKEVRSFPGYTEDDEEFVRQVTRLLEDGALPRPTLKKLSEAFKAEAHPLKLLGIMRRTIAGVLSPQYRILLMLDEDEAGRKAREEIASRLARHCYVRIYCFEKEGQQPDSLSAEELAEVCAP
jgi:superfamily II DNA/RNA helicase